MVVITIYDISPFHVITIIVLPVTTNHYHFSWNIKNVTIVTIPSIRYSHILS